MRVLAGVAIACLALGLAIVFVARQEDPVDRVLARFGTMDLQYLGAAESPRSAYRDMVRRRMTITRGGVREQTVCEALVEAGWSVRGSTPVPSGGLAALLDPPVDDGIRSVAIAPNGDVFSVIFDRPATLREVFLHRVGKLFGGGG